MPIMSRIEIVEADNAYKILSTNLESKNFTEVKNILLNSAIHDEVKRHVVHMLSSNHINN